MGDTDKTIMQIAAERAGLKIIGPEATDDDVQNAVDDADGKHDGDIVNEPESDVQAALQLYRASKQDTYAKLELSLQAARAIFTRGERHIDPEDWAQLGLVLGPALIDAVKQLVALAK